MTNCRVNPELDMLRHMVQQKFADFRAALSMREKLLTRQIEVLEQQQINHSSSWSEKLAADVIFLVDKEDELLGAIRSFGRFQLDNINLACQDIYLKNEDELHDHDTMDKQLADATHTSEPQPEAIVVDFSKNKSLIEHNKKNMHDSIINITLLEAKELIRQAKARRETTIPPLNLEELDDELESSIAEAMSSLGGVLESPYQTKSSQTAKKSKKNRFKPKITINNCNGTINLRNISSLTINCATEEAVSAEIPLPTTKSQTKSADRSSSHEDVAAQKTQIVNSTSESSTLESVSTNVSTPLQSTPTSTTSSSNDCSNSSSLAQSKKHKGNHIPNQGSEDNDSMAVSTTKPDVTMSTNPSAYAYEIIDDTDAEVTCDFYNRLLNEIKKTIKEKTNSARPMHASPMLPDTTDNMGLDSGSVHTSATDSRNISSLQEGRRLILKNFENLKIVLEANSDEETLRPVQIEQWLAEIISETDLEPMQNTDILEHSRIHSE